MRVSIGSSKFIATLATLSMFLAIACGGGDNTGETGGSVENDSANTNLSQPRGLHTATLLNDGRVLVAGGRSIQSYESAEIFDPTKSDDPEVSQWSPAGNMLLDRFDHTATMLSNGLVLMVGGDKETGAQLYTQSKRITLQDSELYDPATNSWSSAGDMPNPHGSGHTATLLDNGKVLVTGGIYAKVLDAPREPSEFSDIYDPAAGTWSTTGDLTKPRARHQAVLLEDGNVLAIDDNSSEIYNVSTGKWTDAGELPSNHGSHFSITVLSNGKILVAGGGSSNWVGGVEVSIPSPIDNADIYDPSTGKWSSAGTMVKAEVFHTASLLQDGRVLVVGPVSAQLYDPDSDSWSEAGSLKTQRGALMIDGPARSFHTATVLNDGRVIIVGGNTLDLSKFGQAKDRIGIGATEIYDPNSGWE